MMKARPDPAPIVKGACSESFASLELQIMHGSSLHCLDAEDNYLLATSLGTLRFSKHYVTNRWYLSNKDVLSLLIKFIK